MASKPGNFAPYAYVMKNQKYNTLTVREKANLCYVSGGNGLFQIRSTDKPQLLTTQNTQLPKWLYGAKRSVNNTEGYLVLSIILLTMSSCVGLLCSFCCC